MVDPTTSPPPKPQIIPPIIVPATGTTELNVALAAMPFTTPTSVPTPRMYNRIYKVFYIRTMLK